LPIKSFLPEIHLALLKSKKSIEIGM